MEIKNVRLYNKAVEKILKREALKSIGGQLPKNMEAFKEKEEEYKAKLKEISKRIANGELDKEIEKQMYLIRLEERMRKDKSGEER